MVTLDWQGYVELHNSKMIRLELLARSCKRLLWRNSGLIPAQLDEPNAAHLMAVHQIEIDGEILVGVHVSPVAKGGFINLVHDAAGIQRPQTG